MVGLAGLCIHRPCFPRARWLVRCRYSHVTLRSKKSRPVASLRIARFFVPTIDYRSTQSDSFVSYQVLMLFIFNPHSRSIYIRWAFIRSCIPCRRRRGRQYDNSSSAPYPCCACCQENIWPAGPSSHARCTAVVVLAVVDQHACVACVHVGCRSFRVRVWTSK